MFQDFYFAAKPEKIAIIRTYCAKHGIDDPIMYVNISKKELANFDKFLVEANILAADKVKHCSQKVGSQES